MTWLVWLMATFGWVGQGYLTAQAPGPASELPAVPLLMPDPADARQPFHGLSFDGTNDYCVVPNLGFSGKVSLTWEAWVFALSPSTYDMAFGFGATTTDRLVFVMLKADTTIQFGFYGDDFDATVTSYTNKWTHIACVYDAAANKRYVYQNGDLRGSNTPTGTLNCSDANYRLGSWTGDGVRFAQGIMCAVRVWNTARTQAQIQAGMYNPWLKDTGLVASYPMLTGSGQVLSDYSGNGKNGQLGSTSGTDTNDPTWTARYRKLTNGGPQQ